MVSNLTDLADLHIIPTNYLNENYPHNKNFNHQFFILYYNSLTMAGSGPKTYTGWWGSLGSPKQKYVTTYTVSPFATKPLKDNAYNAVFNVFRRSKNQVLFLVIPGVIVWNVWAKARDYNEYLYTKEGREELERVNV